MHKKYKDCKLKGYILGAIRNGSTTAKTIHPTIAYSGHIDSLYTELDFLRRYGYITARKAGRISTYSLTKKGYTHALNPTIFKIEKHNQFNKNLQNALEDTLRNDEKVKEWALKFAKEISEHPIIESPNQNISLVNPNAKTDYQFLDYPVSPEELEKCLPILKKLDIREPMTGCSIGNEFWDKVMAHMFGDSKKIVALQDEIEKLKKEKIQSPVFIPAYPSTQKTSADLPASNLSSNWVEQSCYDDKTGKIITKKTRKSKEPTEDEKQKKERRLALARQYKDYTLNKNFFSKWSNGNLRPILMVKDNQGNKKLNIISISNTVSKQNLVKLDYYAENRIGELQLYIESIHATGITICSEISNFRKVLEW